MVIKDLILDLHGLVYFYYVHVYNTILVGLGQ